MTVHTQAPTEITGFDEAILALNQFQARAHVFGVLHDAGQLVDASIAYIHVDNTSRADRMLLTAYDQQGRWLDATMAYNDDGRGLPATSDFAFSHQQLAAEPAIAGSQFASISEDGWIIDAALVRKYNLFDDRRATQRTMTLANLRDMILVGDATALFSRAAQA